MTGGSSRSALRIICAPIDPPDYVDLVVHKKDPRLSRIAALGLLSVARLHKVWVEAGCPQLDQEDRWAIETAIAAAIELLDFIDGDSDNEPALGSPEGIFQRFWAQGSTCDGELGDDNGIADAGGRDEQWQRSEKIVG